MSDFIKATCIVSTTLFVLVMMQIYFSPYQTCKRAQIANDDTRAEWRCAVATRKR